MGMIHPAGTTALRLTGRDVLTVLHRVSTQKLDDLAVGECRPTLLCDFRGRLQHRFVVARMPDESVWLVRSDAPGAELAAAIDRSVFREDVRIEDVSASHLVTAVRTPLSGGAPQQVVMDAGSVVPVQVQECPTVALVLGNQPDALPQGVTPLDTAGAIAEGRARHGHEIVDDFNPFEVGLALAVHLDKGCFTGQESLQRLITYSSVRRQLVAVQGPGVAPETPQQLLAGGQDAGRLTSAASSAGGWSGLAVVRSAALDAGHALVLADGRAVDLEHRFVQARPLGRP